MRRRLTLLTVLLTTATLLTTIPSNAADTGLGWAKTFGSSGWDEAVDAAIDSAGNTVSAGYFEGTVDFDPDPDATVNLSADGRDGFVTKLDADGDLLWPRRIGGPGNGEPLAVAVDSADNVYVCGWFDGTLDLGPGQIQLTGQGSANAFLVKMRPNGTFLWAGALGGSGGANCVDLAVGPSGSVYATGIFVNTVDFNPGPGTFNLTSGGSDVPNPFVLKLDTDGGFEWAGAFSGPSLGWGLGIATDASGNAYATGMLTGAVDFDPGAGTATLVGTLSDVFVS